MERVESNYRKEPMLQEYLEEFGKISDLTSAEKDRLLEEAEAMAKEIPNGDGKDKHLRFIQAIKASLLGETSSSKIYIENEYVIAIGDNKIILKTRIGEIYNFSGLAYFKKEIPEINTRNFKAFDICITEDAQQCWINLRLFKAIQKEENGKKIICI